MFQIIRRWLGFSGPPRPPASGPTVNPSPMPSGADLKPVLAQPAKASDLARPLAEQEAVVSAAGVQFKNAQAPAASPSVPSARASASTGEGPGARSEPEPDLDRPSPGVRYRKPIETWACLLRDIDVAKIAKIDVDLMVVDYSADGSDGRAFDTASVSRMKGRPNSGGQSAGHKSDRRKQVIAFMSIGEAEAYRYYWNKDWQRKDHKPNWLDHENPDWDENYKVHYWDPGWQRIIFGSPQSYLDRIIAAGFDGAYLDIIDAYEYYERQHPSAREDMIAFVTVLAIYARQKRPDFMVIPQNGEALLKSALYRAAISAIAKEDLYYGVTADEAANTEAETQAGLELLELARRDGIPVMVVEYLDDSAKIKKVHGALTQLGYCAYFAPQEHAGLREAASPRQA